MSGRRDAGARWIEVRVTTSVPAAEAVGAALHDLRIGGLVEERFSSDRVLLRCYLPASRLSPAIIETLRTRIRGLKRYGIDPRPARIARRVIAARGWATAWRAHVTPVRVGRLYVRPSWVRAPHPPGLTVIAIDPGMAFGAGSHPSTQLCLRALQSYLRGYHASRRRGGPVVFDVGTGSGILAIAAARLGASRVWAVDNDPVAVAVARNNVKLNSVGARVRVVRGSGLDRAPGRADVILANLVAETIVPLLGRTRMRLRPGGVFVGSGIVAGRLGDVERAARMARLRSMRVLSRGEWRAVVYAPSAGTPRRRGR